MALLKPEAIFFGIFPAHCSLPRVIALPFRLQTPDGWVKRSRRSFARRSALQLLRHTANASLRRADLSLRLMVHDRQRPKEYSNHRDTENTGLRKRDYFSRAKRKNNIFAASPTFRRRKDRVFLFHLQKNDPLFFTLCSLCLCGESLYSLCNADSVVVRMQKHCRPSPRPKDVKPSPDVTVMPT